MGEGEDEGEKLIIDILIYSGTIIPKWKKFNKQPI